jgi:hypothetical protein
MYYPRRRGGHATAMRHPGIASSGVELPHDTASTPGDTLGRMRRVEAAADHVLQLLAREMDDGLRLELEYVRLRVLLVLDHVKTLRFSERPR